MGGWPYATEYRVQTIAFHIYKHPGLNPNYTYRITCYLGIRNTGIQEYRNTGIQGYRNTGIQIKGIKPAHNTDHYNDIPAFGL